MPASPAPDEPPRYRQVKDFIVERILAGAWPTGHRVPSERILTDDFQVSRMTVHRALRELTAEGWLTRAQGAGTFVAEQKPQLALLEIRNIRSEVLERGHDYASRVIELARASCRTAKWRKRSASAAVSAASTRSSCTWRTASRCSSRTGT